MKADQSHKPWMDVMRYLVALLFAALLVVPTVAEDKPATIQLAGMKADVPKGWKEEKPSNEMRLTQFKLPKVKGDDEDAELAVFYFKMGSGTVEQNLKRQEAKFEIPEGVKKEDAIKVEKSKVGGLEATYQDVKGTFLSKFPPFAPNAKVTKKEKFRQLYVLFEDKDGGQYYITVLGPEKTIESHKKDFDAMLKSFK
jgi:hypothetical protein